MDRRSWQATVHAVIKSHSGMINYCFYVGSFVDFCLEALICGGLSFWGAIATDDHWLEQGSMEWWASEQNFVYIY